MKISSKIPKSFSNFAFNATLFWFSQLDVFRWNSDPLLFFISFSSTDKRSNGDSSLTSLVFFSYHSTNPIAKNKEIIPCKTEQELLAKFLEQFREI